MARLPTLKEESDAVVKEGGYYVPPFKLAEFSKVASKIFDLMIRGGTFQASYTDCEIILSIVRQTINAAREKEAPRGTGIPAERT